MKNNLLLLILLGLIYIGIGCVLPITRNAVFWASCTHLMCALLMQFALPDYVFEDGDTTSSKFYGISVISVFSTYLIVQFIASTIFIIFSTYIQLWIVLLVNLLILGFAVSGIFITDAIKSEIERQDNNTNLITSNFKQLTIEINCILDSCTIDSVKKELAILVDEFKYSDPVSNDSLSEIELELKESIKLLQEYVDNKKENESLDLISQMKLVLENRNKMCKLNK